MRLPLTATRPNWRKVCKTGKKSYTPKNKRRWVLVPMRLGKRLRTNSHLIIDIRESYEEPRLENHGIHNIPLAQLENFIATVAQNQKVILFCQRGHQSQMAADYLTHKGFRSILHLQHGIEGLT
jgi:rhodanese-related sulfurtransferase